MPSVPCTGPNCPVCAAGTESQVTFCAWCPVPTEPDPLHHPNGQVQHITEKKANA